LFWRQVRRILLASAITLICGFCGILLFLLSYNHTPLSSAECLGAYLLAWPLILIEHMGGVEDFMGRPVPEQQRVIWSGWIALWVYYYVLHALWRRMRRLP